MTDSDATRAGERHRTSSRFCQILVLAFTCVFLILSFAWPAPSQAQGGLTAQRAGNTNTVIAYVAPSRDNQAIRLVNADGSNPRTLWQAQQGLARELGPGDLNWRPDAAEIAFDSAHDLFRSMLMRDIYALASDGSYLRRLTRAPDPSSFDLYPKGTVTFTVVNSSFTRELDVFIEGAKGSVRQLMPAGMAWVFTFSDVADFGPGVRQYVRLLDVNAGPSALNRVCFFELGWFADVIANNTVSLGTINPVPNEYNCPIALSPSWRADGKKAAFVMREATKLFSPPNNIWQADAAPAPATYGERLLDYGQFATTDRLYLVAYGTGPRQDQLIFVENGATITPIYIAPAGDPANRTYLNLGLCPRVTCWVTGLSWLPDGSGFVFSRQESGPGLGNPPPEGGAIYLYDLSTNTFRQVFRAPGEALGRLSVSPDGRMIAFERAPRLEDTVARVTVGPKLLCPCSIWTVGIDGAGAKRLVADGRAPAWSPAAPKVVPPGATPAPTAAPNPNLKPSIWLPVIRRDP